MKDGNVKYDEVWAQRMLEKIEEYGTAVADRVYNGLSHCRIPPDDAYAAIATDLQEMVAHYKKVSVESLMLEVVPGPDGMGVEVYAESTDQVRGVLTRMGEKTETRNDLLQAAMHGWLRVVDDELVSTHIGVAEATDTYEIAKEKLAQIIAWHVAVATDPAVNGGFKLVPVCCACDKKATWVRVTQFAGEHHYCHLHAQQESDFGESDSYEFWKKEGE